MSDFSIPGTGSDKYGTQKLIEGLMKVERVPRDKAEARLKELEKQKTVWQDMNQRLGILRDGARELYSFQNPFNERTAKSSNEEALTATATREALEQTRTIFIEKAAAADRFLSSELSKDYKVPAGTYAFVVGEKRIELRYAGGTLKDFAEAVNRKGGDTVRAQVVAIRSDTQSLVVESLKTGQSNRLAFEKDAIELAQTIGMAEKIATARRDLDPAKALPWEKPLDAATKAETGKLSITAGGEAKLALPAPVPTEGMVLEIEYRLVALPQAPVPLPPPGPDLAPVGSASYEGISVFGASSVSALPEWRAPVRPPVVEDRKMANVLAPDGAAFPLPELEDGEASRKLSVELKDYGERFAGLAFRVKDTTRRLEVTKARIFNPAESGGIRPLHPISVAGDAVVSVDGIQATRPDNAISDLIPGVTLNVKEASKEPVKLKIEPDREAVKESLIGLVGNYDKLMALINVLSRADETVIDQLSYLDEDEKKTARERLGLLQGDSTLSLMRSSLQRIMMDPYTTEYGDRMRLLAQVGISTDARRPGSGQGFDASRLRGYLEIDEATLGKALQENFEGVRQLFGYDTDGDLLVDSGAAFALDSLIKPYVETGGILSLKTTTINSQATSEKRKIEDLDRQLVAKESELKRKYGSMESSLNRMEGVSSSIDAFSKQGNNN